MLAARGNLRIAHVITFVDPEWAHDLTGLNVGPDERLQEFIRVRTTEREDTSVHAAYRGKSVFNLGRIGGCVSL